MTEALTPELMLQATRRSAITVYDRIPASDFEQAAECMAEAECWRQERGMWVCSPCLFRFRDIPGSPDAADLPRAEERLAEHIQWHLSHSSPVLIAFYCQRHLQFERPSLEPSTS